MLDQITQRYLYSTAYVYSSKTTAYTCHCTTSKFRNTTTNMVTNCCTAQKSATAAQSPQSIKIDRCCVGFNKIKENNRKCGAVRILLPILKCDWFL